MFKVELSLSWVHQIVPKHSPCIYGEFTYIYRKESIIHVGKYLSHIDLMGKRDSKEGGDLSKSLRTKDPRTNQLDIYLEIPNNQFQIDVW